jgi:hypothetical protein
MMKVTPMEPMEVNPEKPLNPFCQDLYHMGFYVGLNVAVMHSNHSREFCRYLIVVDLETGERLRIELNKEV